MAHRFAELMFTPSVKAAQQAMGSRGAYERFEEPEAPTNDTLSEVEANFIAERDSFYMATVSETGWPYVQHRGGPRGFLKVLDGKTLGFADYKGNRQYVSVGNLAQDDRVSLFLVDYPNRRRLKLLGHVQVVDGRSAPEILEQLKDVDYGARIERGMVIKIEAFDWNCPQHITPRFTEDEIRELTAPMMSELAQLRRDALAISEASAAKVLTSEAKHVPTVMGTGELELVITGMRQLTPRVRAYELRSPDGSLLPSCEAGAHIAVPVRLDDGTASTRSYSISSDPGNRQFWEIAVALDEQGRGGSRAVHRDYALGLRLRCSRPVNAFPLHDDNRPALLLAGGIGITPLKAMAYVLRGRATAVKLHYCARAPGEAAYQAELKALMGDDAVMHFGTAPFDCEGLLADAPGNAILYVCGPAGLIDAARAASARLGWPADRVRYERFDAPGSAQQDTAFEIVLERSGRTVHVGANESALSALEREGLPIASSCRSGTCGTCAVRIKAGQPDHRDSVLSDADRAAGAFATCVSRAHSNELVIDL